MYFVSENIAVSWLYAGFGYRRSIERSRKMEFSECTYTISTDEVSTAFIRRMNLRKEPLNLQKREERKDKQKTSFSTALNVVVIHQNFSSAQRYTVFDSSFADPSSSVITCFFCTSFIYKYNMRILYVSLRVHI